MRSAASLAADFREGRTTPSQELERRLNAIDLQEYRLIQQALRAEGGGIRRAATSLGITHQALLRRLEKWPELRQVAPRATQNV